MKAISEIDDPRLVKALAHPLRVQILRVLENRTASPNEIANEIGAPLTNVSYHVRALARVGLIEMSDTAPRRGAVEHYYRAVGRVRVTDKAWAEVPSIVKAGLVDSALSQIGQSASAAAVNGGFERTEAVLTRHALRLDDEGFRQLAREAVALVDRARAISQESERRVKEAPHTARKVPACLAVMLFDDIASAGDDVRRVKDPPSSRTSPRSSPAGPKPTAAP